MLLAGRTAARFVAAAFAIAAVAYTGILWHLFQPAAQGMQFQELRTWEPSIGLQYHVGADGLSLVMLAVSSMVVLMAIAASWHNAKQGPLYFSLLLFLETGLFGAYTALNFLHWFLYWELSLIPAFFLIRLWGGSGRARAATQFFIYTMVGSITLLLSFLALYLASNTYDFIELKAMAQDGQLAAAIGQNLHWHQWDAGRITLWLFAGAFLGFAVKTPVVPFHAWLPSAYAEAAPETTMVLTGALSKMGVYGFLRILLPIFPEQMWRARHVLLWLAIATIVLPAFTAWAQKDLKRMFAYSSINHLGYCILGIVAVASSTSAEPGIVSAKAAALTGVMLQLFSHGITRRRPVLVPGAARTPQRRPDRAQRFWRIATRHARIQRIDGHRHLRLPGLAGVDRLSRRIPHLQRSLPSLPLGRVALAARSVDDRRISAHHGAACFFRTGARSLGGHARSHVRRALHARTRHRPHLHRGPLPAADQRHAGEVLTCLPGRSISPSSAPSRLHFYQVRSPA